MHSLALLKHFRIVSYPEIGFSDNGWETPPCAHPRENLTAQLIFLEEPVNLRLIFGDRSSCPAPIRVSVEQSASVPMTMVLNWQAMLKK